MHGGLFRDSTLDAVAKHCAEQLEQYSACVTAHPDSWESDCTALQAKLAECSEEQYVGVREWNEFCMGRVFFM